MNAFYTANVHGKVFTMKFLGQGEAITVNIDPRHTECTYNPTQRIFFLTRIFLQGKKSFACPVWTGINN